MPTKHRRRWFQKKRWIIGLAFPLGFIASMLHELYLYLQLHMALS